MPKRDSPHLLRGRNNAVFRLPFIAPITTEKEEDGKEISLHAILEQKLNKMNQKKM